MTTDPLQAAIDALAYMSDVMKGAGLLQAAITLGEVTDPDAVIEQLRAHQSAQGWQPIETAPIEKNIVFLVGSREYGCYVVVRTSDSYELKDKYPFHTYTGGHAVTPEKATHWKPLDKPPATIKAAGGE